MQIELAPDTQDLLQKQLARDGFPTVDAVIEEAIQFYESHRPTMESLNAKLLAAHEAFEAGDLAPLDADDIKRRGRERLADKKAVE